MHSEKDSELTLLPLPPSPTAIRPSQPPNYILRKFDSSGLKILYKLLGCPNGIPKLSTIYVLDFPMYFGEKKK